MRRVLVLSAIWVTMLSTTASANGLQLSWNVCPGVTGAAKTVTFDCDPGAGTVYDLIGTFQFTTTALGVVAVDGITDLRFEGQVDVPPFWHFQLNGCNEFGLNMVDSRPASCTAFTNTMCGAGGGACDGVITAFGLNYKGPGTGRLLFTLARSASSPTDLAAEPTKHFAFDLQFFMDNAATCAGCNTPVSFVWNMAVLYNTSATGTGEEGTAAILSSTDPASDPCVNINGGTLAGCGQTPTRRNSWGQLKSLYR